MPVGEQADQKRLYQMLLSYYYAAHPFGQVGEKPALNLDLLIERANVNVAVHIFSRLVSYDVCKITTYPDNSQTVVLKKEKIAIPLR